MRFALLGDHPDGVAMARALMESGRHRVIYLLGPPAMEIPSFFSGAPVKRVGDLEALLADPEVEAVVVASRADARAAHLRRVLQSERHALCVHPVDFTPDAAYEATMIQGDTKKVLIPLLTDSLHPAFANFKKLIENSPRAKESDWLVTMTRRSRGTIIERDPLGKHRPSFPGWDILRLLNGEVAEISAFAKGEEAEPNQPLVISGRFDRGGLFQITFLPARNDDVVSVTFLGTSEEGRLVFTQGLIGPAYFKVRRGAGELEEQHWDACPPWPKLIQVFEEALAHSEASAPLLGTEETRMKYGHMEKESASEKSQTHLTDAGADALCWPTWQDAVRGLELDDAARRSLERRRVSTLDYQEATEEASFKGTMTLVGCGLLWAMVLLLILAAWYPKLGWVFLPLLVGFLGLQLLRWLVPRPDRK